VNADEEGNELEKKMDVDQIGDEKPMTFEDYEAEYCQ
jgi:hypothetical protein